MMWYLGCPLRPVRFGILLRGVLAIVMSAASTLAEERRLEVYEVGVHGGEGSLQVERWEYDAQCGVDPKKLLKVAGADPVSLERDWHAIGAAPIRPPLLDPPTYKAEKFRIVYRGKLVGEIPGNIFHHARFGFTSVPRFVVEKAIAVGDDALVLSTASMDPPKESNAVAILSNPDRVYVAKQLPGGSWRITESVVHSAQPTDGGKGAGAEEANPAKQP